MKNEEKIIMALQYQLTSGRFKSLNELSAFLGLTETTKSKLYNVFNKDMNAGYKTICEWFDKLGISLLDMQNFNENYYSIENLNTSSAHTNTNIKAEMLDKKNILAPVISRLNENAPSEEVKGENLHLMPVYGFTGAGGEVELIENEPIAFISILPQYNHKDMYPLKVIGDSMQPTIPKGSYVGITPYNGILQEGGVYLVEKEHMGRMIKRIKINTIGELALYSDNQEYEPIPLDKILLEGKIIGRIMWVLRMP